MIRPLDVVIGLDVPPPLHTQKKALWHPSVFLILQSDTVVVRDPAGILTAYACQANVFEACMRIHHHHLYRRGVTHDLGDLRGRRSRGMGELDRRRRPLCGRLAHAFYDRDGGGVLVSGDRTHGNCRR